MEAHRSRRTRDRARKAWYAYYRQVRFARWFGFIEIDGDVNRAFRTTVILNKTTIRPCLEDPVNMNDWNQPAPLLQPPALSAR
jgi:hypothetical protein